MLKVNVRGVERWCSEFPLTAGRNDEDVPRGGCYLSVASYANKALGGHAQLYMEYFNGMTPTTEKLHLTNTGPTGAWHVASEPHDMDNVYTQIPTFNNNLAQMRRPYGNYCIYLAWSLRDSIVQSVHAAAARFQAKLANGHYVGSQVNAGVIGRVFSRRGARSVNCADFAIKILEDVHLANPNGGGWYNTPKSVSGGSWLPWL
jgi:hypothetical protein